MTDPVDDDSPRGAVVGDDGIARCMWAVTDPLLRDYHDEEWGRPVHGEHALFERISLEGFQAGLSWRTVLAKRPAFRVAFDGFDADAVAAFTDDRLEALMDDAGIIRNRAKILATRSNARAIIALRDHGGIDHFLWSRRPEPSPPPITLADARTTSPDSIALAKDLRKAGITKPIMVMSPEEQSFDAMLRFELEAEIYSRRTFDGLLQAMSQHGHTGTVRIHLKLNTGMNRLGFDTLGSQTPIVPVLVGPDELAMAFWKGLWEEGVFTTPALPPGVPNGQSIIRTSVNANHESDQLEKLLAAFALVGKRLGVIQG